MSPVHITSLADPITTTTTARHALTAPRSSVAPARIRHHRLLLRVALGEVPLRARPPRRRRVRLPLDRRLVVRELPRRLARPLLPRCAGLRRSSELPLRLEPFSLSLAAKASLSALSSQTLFWRGAGAWLVADRALFGPALGTQDRDSFKANLRAADGTTAVGTVAWSTTGVSDGGDVAAVREISRDELEKALREQLRRSQRGADGSHERGSGDEIEKADLRRQ